MKERVERRGKKHVPLGDQILQSEAPVIRRRIRQMERREEEDAAAGEFIAGKVGRRLMQQAREQQEEEEGRGSSSAAAAASSSGAFSLGQMDGSDDEDDAGQAGGAGYAEDPNQYYADLQIDAGDELALQAFMPEQPSKRLTLADIILGKIKEKGTEIASQMSESNPMPNLDDRIIRVYKHVGQILSRYRSGKLPKAFKIIPSLANWEEILYITDPDQWTAAAMFQASRIFASNLSAKMAQRFYNLILLPRFRDDIAEFRRLNFHLFMALKKSLFKPAAFFKGILLPLCEAGDCTLREAVIMSSALSRTSIPALHSSAAILKLAEMRYSGANSIFLRVLLDKKYALPYRVIDGLVFHFIRFQSDQRTLPVLWHQCFLVFAQRYKEDITSEQKEALMEVLRAHTHAGITPEIRRELLQSRSRDREMPLEPVDETMN